MPLFKVAVVPNRSRKITCCAGSIRELIEKSLSALSAAADADSYEAYDDSDCLIADDECLIALAEDRRAARSGLQEVTLVPHGQAWPGSGSSGPDKDVNRPASSSVPTITISSEDVALLRKAVESPPHLRTRALLRAKRKVVQHLVDKLKASPPAPGDIRKICERVKVACPNAFVLAIRENEVGDSFLPFVKSVYNSLGYALCCDGSKARRRRRRAQTDEEDADDPALQTVVLHCTDSNGCAEGMWGPSFSPEEKEQFASIQQSLLTDYSAAQFGPLDSGVVDLVKECFPLTRSDINDARTAADWKKVFTSWPVLQHYEPFLAHANLLMGKVCEEVWADSFADPLPLVKFMTDYCSPVDGKPCATERLTSMNLFLKKSAEAVEQRENNGPMKDVAFPFLVYYFREKMDLLFLLVDAHATIVEVKEKVEAVTQSPVLVVKGLSIFDPNAHFLVVVRAQFVIQTPSFLEGMLTLLLSYFVLNIEFPKGLFRTLEFMQRYFLLVNPTVQIRKEGRVRTKVNSSVATLANKLAAFEAAQSRWIV